jgi:tryptophan-rich sensory protein
MFKMHYNRKVDLILPWVAFAVLAIVGVWLIAVNGQWWRDSISKDVMPSTAVYYIIWSIFLLAFPITYTLALSNATLTGHRIAIHVMFMLVMVFLLLWVIYLYAVKNVRIALIFMGIAALLMLLTSIYVFVVEMQYRGSPVAGMIFILFLWLASTFYITSAAREEGLRSMFDTLKERYLANKRGEADIQV